MKIFADINITTIKKKGKNMLTHPTLNKIKELKLYGIARAFTEQMDKKEYNKLSFEERLGMLIDTEAAERDNRRLVVRLAQAKLKQQACIEDIDYEHARKLDKSLMLSLASCGWIKEKLNILITGLTGAGKTYIACAIGHRACLSGYKVMYFRAPRLFEELAIAHGDGRYSRVMNTIAKSDVLIIDDFGLSTLNEQNRRDFLEILEDRHNMHSTIISGQVPIDHWYEVIGNATIADAILDRLVHNAYKIDLKGGSMRKIKSKLT